MASPLERFLPDLLRRRLHLGASPIDAAYCEEVPGTALFCDITGFTPLTESLVREGPDGVERLTEILNSYFGQLIDLVQGHGGDIVKFAGDALLALWQCPDAVGLRDSTRRAVQCGLEIQKRLTGFDSGAGVKLQQRVAIGCGTLQTAYLGGALGRWEFVVAGEPLRQITPTMATAKPGSVAVADEAWGLVGNMFRGSPTSASGTRIDRVTTPLPICPLEPSDVPADVEDAMRMYIPGAVLSRMDAGQAWWLGELRLVSVIFVHFPTLAFDPDSLDEAQEAVHSAQNAVYRWEGTVNKVNVDDKGASMLAALGLRPLAHEDDPERAVRAALDVHRRLTDRSIPCSVGVTTGKVYCGVVGNEVRCEYTMHGDIVNMAARLMQAAQGRVLVDEPTYRASVRRLDYVDLEPIAVKGREEPLSVFQPTGTVKRRVRAQTEIVGRAEELATLSEYLQGTLRAHENRIAVVQGEAGIGKSRIVAEFMKTVEHLGVRSLLAEGRAIERSTAYFGWRTVFEAVFGIEAADSQDEQEAKATAWLAEDEELAPLTPLLSALLPVDIPDNEITGQMRDQVRADNINSLLTRILQRHAGGEPLLLIVEDAHWLDSASWALLAAASRELHPALFLIVTRPLEPPDPKEYFEIAGRPDTRPVEPSHLSPEETLQLVCQRLGVARLPSNVGELVTAKAEGNPFFAEEIAYSLRDGGQLVVEDGKARLAEAGADLGALELPDTVQGVIISRVDRLTPSQQLLLKVASVIGREFGLSLLTEVFPAEAGREGIPEGLRRLIDLDIVQEEEPGPDPTYLFRHALGLEAVYGLMLFEQRREYHRVVAEWYERNYRSDLTPYYTLLAHHWSRAEDHDKGLEFLQKAGDQARARFANREAVGYYESALELLPAKAPAEQRLSLTEGLATSYYGIGNLDACRRNCHTALRLLGWRMPSSPPTLVLGLLKQIVLRMLQAKLPGRFVESSLDRRSRRLRAVKLQNFLTEVHGFRGEDLPFLLSSFREVNLAHPAGPSFELGRSLGMMAIVLGTLGLHKICDAAVARAMEIAGGLSEIARAFVLTRCAPYELYFARWRAVEDWTGEVLETTARYPNRRLQEEAGAERGWAMYYQGRYPEAEEIWSRVLAWGRASYNDQTEGWARVSTGLAQGRQGRAQEGLDHYEQAAEYIERAGTAERTMSQGGQALLLLLAGRPDEARPLADEVLDRVDGKRPMAYYAYQALTALTEVYFTLLGAAEGSARSLLLKQCKRATKALTAHAKVFPFATTASLYWEGRMCEVTGDEDGAREVLRRCATVGEEMGIIFERGLACQALGRLLPAGEEREQYRSEGRRLLAEAGIPEEEEGEA